MAKRRARPTAGDWRDRIEQGIRFKNDFCGAKDWQTFREFYRGNFQGIGQGGADTYSGDFLPYNLTYAIARAQVPNIYFRNPYVTITPRFKPGMEIHAKVVEAIDNWLIQEMSLKKQMKTAVLDAFLCGRGIIKLGYDSEFGYSTKDALVEMGLEDETATSFARGKSDREKIEYNVNIKPGMPWCQRVDPDMYVVPFGARDEDELSWADHIIIRPLIDAKLDMKYKNMEDITGTHFEKALTSLNKNRIYQEYSKNIDWVEIHEIHDAKRRELLAMVTAEDGKYIRGPIEDEMQIEGLPFVSIAFNEDPEFFWCPSDARLMAPQQVEMNESRTQAMKHRRVAIVKAFARKNSITKAEADKMLSSQVMPLVWTDGDPNNCVAFTNPGIPPELVQWPEVIRSDVREMFGMGKNQLGSQMSGRKTAKEASIIQSAQELRMDERRDIMADVVSTIVRKVNQIIFTHWTPERAVQVVGYDGARYWVEYDRDAVKGEYDVKIDVDSLTPSTKAMKRKDLVELITALGNNPRVNLDYLLKQLLREYDWLDAMKILPEAPESQGGQTMGMEQYQQQQQGLLNNPQQLQSRSAQNANQVGRTG